MHYLDYNEKKQHGTLDFPIEYYHVNEHHPRYNMPFHCHKELEIIRGGETSVETSAAGLSGDKTGDAAAGAAGEGQITFTFAEHVANIEQQAPQVYGVVQEYMKLHPNVTIELTAGLYYPKQHGVDFYHRFEEDLGLMEEMGFKAFRTSFDWSRIYPKGDEEEPNEAGLRYYDRLITSIRSHGMEPFMTISHYEMPVHLVKKYGGWLNRSLVDFFAAYCNTLFERYHGQIKYWIVFNQINLTTFNSLGILGNRSVIMSSAGSAPAERRKSEPLMVNSRYPFMDPDS